MSSVPDHQRQGDMYRYRYLFCFHKITYEHIQEGYFIQNRLIISLSSKMAPPSRPVYSINELRMSKLYVTVTVSYTFKDHLCICTYSIANMSTIFKLVHVPNSETHFQYLELSYCMTWPWYITSNWTIQSSAVITRSIITRYCIHHWRNRGRISRRDWIHKNTPYLALTGELSGVFCGYFCENWPRHNGKVLY